MYIPSFHINLLSASFTCNCHIPVFESSVSTWVRLALTRCHALVLFCVHLYSIGCLGVGSCWYLCALCVLSGDFSAPAPRHLMPALPPLLPTQLPMILPPHTHSHTHTTAIAHTPDPPPLDPPLHTQLPPPLTHTFLSPHAAPDWPQGTPAAAPTATGGCNGNAAAAPTAATAAAAAGSNGGGPKSAAAGSSACSEAGSNTIDGPGVWCGGGGEGLRASTGCPGNGCGCEG